MIPDTGLQREFQLSRLHFRYMQRLNANKEIIAKCPALIRFNRHLKLEKAVKVLLK